MNGLCNLRWVWWHFSLLHSTVLIFYFVGMICWQRYRVRQLWSILEVLSKHFLGCRLEVQGSNPCKGKRFLSFPKTSRPTLGPTQPCIQRMLVFFPRVKWPGHEVNNSRPFNFKAKKEWSCTFTPPICLHGMDRKTLPLPLLSRHHQPYKPLNQGCYWYYYYRCINFSVVKAHELKHCTVIPSPTQTLGPIMTCWTELCCITLYGSEVTWTHLLPASAAIESVTTHTYPCVFKIFSIQQIFLCILFSATLSQNHTGWEVTVLH